MTPLSSGARHADARPQQHIHHIHHIRQIRRPPHRHHVRQAQHIGAREARPLRRQGEPARRRIRLRATGASSPHWSHRVRPTPTGVTAAKTRSTTPRPLRRCASGSPTCALAGGVDQHPHPGHRVDPVRVPASDNGSGPSTGESASALRAPGPWCGGVDNRSHAVQARCRGKGDRPARGGPRTPCRASALRGRLAA
jgi:hypothetical protein